MIVGVRGDRIKPSHPDGSAPRCPVARGPRRDKVIVEMRTYKTKPGMRSRFVEIFLSKSVPAHNEIGMKVLGPFLAVDDPDTFFFMRGFPDLSSRDPMKAQFYEGELWKQELEQVVMPMLERYEVTLVDDPGGLIQWPDPRADAGACVEGRRHGGAAK
jgi:hypothetical protein